MKDFCNVMGPFLVTPEDIDPSNLKMIARINGEVWSEGNSEGMYWSWGELIELVSMDETIYPGDFIGSGTIENGCGLDHGRWIKPGDIVELEIEGIGILRNRVGQKPEIVKSLRLRRKE
jgi:2-keto-4-pentenoate hydratase/2-oxohepta-3-ene-1,7-dioic acid hydratase in catechol pathway